MKLESQNSANLYRPARQFNQFYSVLSDIEQQVSKFGPPVLGLTALIPFVQAAYHAAKTPGLPKLVPLMNMVDQIGAVSQQTCLFLLRGPKKVVDFAAPAAKALSSLGFAGLILHFCAIGVEAWDLHSLRIQEKEFKQALKNNLLKAFDSLHANHGVRKFFRMLSPKESELVKEITQKYHDNSAALGKLAGLINRRFTELRTMKAIGIALTVIAAVGYVMLAFLPTPAALIIWGCAGIAVTAGLFLGISYFIQSQIFKHALRRQLQL